MQMLIQPINKAIISAGYLNDSYEKKFGFKHWGVDMYGEMQLWCQGHGIVTAKGTDSMYGNFVQIVYPEVLVPASGEQTIVANYFHLASFGDKIVNGQWISKDTKLGIAGKTGTYANGVHLHIEMRSWCFGEKRMLSPFASQHFEKNLSCDWFNPLDIMYCKINAPDYQTRAFADHIYTNINDRFNVMEVR